MKKSVLVLSLLLAVILLGCNQNTKQSEPEKKVKADPLPSWNEGPAKKSIIDFVNVVTTETSPDFIKPVDRIAVFDNDGTLWAEQPYYFQLQFAIDRGQRACSRTSGME